MEGRASRRARKGALLVLIGIVAVTASGISQASAAETHAFDPVLSLTGNCVPTTVDPVEDPSCPYPAPPTGPRPFSNPDAVTTDSYGDIYVVSHSAKGEEGRIDVFDSEGNFITEVADKFGPRNAVIDDEGNLYVFEFGAGIEQIRRFPPSVYEPSSSEIAYEKKPVMVTETTFGSFFVGLAINKVNQHLFANVGQSIVEFSSASEGNKVLNPEVGKGILSGSQGIGLAIDAARGRIYASDINTSKFPPPAVVRVFELDPPYALLETIDGSSTPPGRFLGGVPSMAVDEATGNLFVYDGEGAEVVYELTKDGE